MKLKSDLLPLLPRHKSLDSLPETKAKKTETFRTLILTFIALSFFVFFAINPTLSTISQLNKQLEDSKVVEKQLEEKISHLSALQQQYAQIEPEIPVVFSSIPQGPKVALFIAQLQAITRKSSITVLLLQTFPVEISKNQSTDSLAIDKPDYYFSYIFAINIEGEYKNISNFLNSLVSFQRLVTIDSLSITKSPGNSEKIQLSVRGKTYFKI